MNIIKNNSWVFSDPTQNFTGTGVSPAKDTYLIIFPHAGGSPSFYRNWTQFLPKNYECWIALMPGRESRFHEPPHQSIHDAVSNFYKSFLGMQKKRKIVVYGHSLGSILAFEFARQIQKSFHNISVLLAVSGRAQPEQKDDKLKDTLALDNINFFKKIAEDYGGVDQEILNSPDYIELLAPILRADMQMSFNYRMRASDKLNCPILAFGGSNDEGATASDMINWQSYTTYQLQIKTCTGGHFFITDNAKFIINKILKYNLT